LNNNNNNNILFRFIFGDLSAHIQTTMIKPLANMGIINSFGIQQIRKNVFTLLRKLPSILLENKETLFTQIQEYYELLELSPEVISL